MNRKSARHSPLKRALDLLMELRARRFGMDYGEVEDHLGVSRREAIRYIQALEDAGIKLETRREIGDRGGLRKLFRLVDVRGYKLVDPRISQL